MPDSLTIDTESSADDCTLDITATMFAPQRSDPFAVALVCMPFASAERPSIQLGLLSSIAQQHGFSVDSFYFNLDLAAQLTPALYESLCEHRGNLTGEWLFGPAAFGVDEAEPSGNYLAAFPEEVSWAGKLGRDDGFLIDLRLRVLPEFIETCLNETDWSRYQVVGFSSTFQQNVACLALAQRIKERYPQIIIVFGGANLEAEMGMELMRSFPFVDFAISGEADIAFPSFLRALNDDQNLQSVPGLLRRDADGAVVGSQAEPVQNMDLLPTPNYQSYFDKAAALGLLQHYGETLGLPFESSRGCWWGQKHHCTFCGLNGLGMAFRAKSPERVLRELSELASSYSVSNFEAVDNILDLKYVQQFFARIEETKSDYEFFYEVKANLTQAQLRTLRRGGMRCIQPGIESMSSHVLKLMRKGSTMLQNVRCLKWSLYYGINVCWNLLWGFPEETETDYEEELEVLKSIQHLQPPTSCSRIWLERFSPYYNEQSKFGVRNLRPTQSYSYVYPSHVDLPKLAYFFDYEMDNTAAPVCHRPTEALVAEWRRAWSTEQRQTLTYRRTEDNLFIDFNWGPERRGTYPLSGPLAQIYELCGATAVSPQQVMQGLHELRQEAFTIEELREALDEFCSARLMLKEGDLYLSLAIPRNPNW
jgi:ribosomal peptide maturation radical SAM protein 1